MQTVVCRLQSAGVRDERTDGSVISARLAEVEVARWGEHTVLQLRRPHEDQRARRSQHRLLRSALLFICQLTAKRINEGSCQKLSGEGASSVLAAILPRSDSRQCSCAERVEPLTACLNRWCVGSCARREVSFGAGAVHARTQIRQRARQSAAEGAGLFILYS